MEDLHPGRSLYNAPSAQRLTGNFDAARFDAAFKEIIRRQPALRTRMGTDPQTGRPAQLIAESVDFTLPVIDLRKLPADQREAELAELMQEIADEPIDIHRAPMMHAAVFQLDEHDHVFLFVPHHLVWDGWSFDLLQRELSAIYDAAERGRAHTLPAIATTHGDYAEWLAGWMQEPAFQPQLDFWLERFAKAPMPRLPRTDMPRRAGKSGQGGAQWIRVDLAVTQQLRKIARDMDVTLSMLTFGIYALTMSRVIGSETVVIANPVRGRQQPETEDVMGFFNNVLPVSLTVDANAALPDFMRYVKGELLALMNYQQVPFERLMAEPVLAGRIRAVGPYQAMFSFQDARDRARRLGSLQTRQMHLMQRGATDDIGVWLMDKPHGLEGALIYNADIYLRETGAQLRDRYLEVLHRVVEQPGATLAALAAEEGSPSALYLRRLTAAEPPKTPAAEGAAPGAKAEEILLNPEHAKLAQIWASVIGIDVNDIRPTDNFFDLGGDSLLVLRAVEQAERTLGYHVASRRYLFENLGQIAATAHAAFDEADTDPEPARVPLAQLKSATRSEGLLSRAFGGWLRRE